MPDLQDADADSDARADFDRFRNGPPIDAARIGMSMLVKSMFGISYVMEFECKTQEEREALGHRIATYIDTRTKSEVTSMMNLIMHAAESLVSCQIGNEDGSYDMTVVLTKKADKKQQKSATLTDDVRPPFGFSNN